jgi:hypothetical protein
MPSDLIRGWAPVRVKKTRQNKIGSLFGHHGRNLAAFGVIPQ